jgi:hypothetical protein
MLKNYFGDFRLWRLLVFALGTLFRIKRVCEMTQTTNVELFFTTAFERWKYILQIQTRLLRHLFSYKIRWWKNPTCYYFSICITIAFLLTMLNKDKAVKHTHLSFLIPLFRGLSWFARRIFRWAMFFSSVQH